MPYIIDGNNLIGSSPDISLEDTDARSKVINIVRKFQQNKNNNVILVFDGEPENGTHCQTITTKFTVVYPRYGNSADDEIMRTLNSYSYFKDVILVTSDRDLKLFARKKGAKTINSIEFHFELKRFNRIVGKKEDTQKRIETRLSKNEVDQWLEVFQHKKD
jgi:predicted RNA-binding protein with PIN domain